MSIFIKNKSFRSIVLTHFCTTVNNNFYKTLLLYFLLKITTEEPAFIIGKIGFLFVLPFLLLTAFSGSLSDKFSKHTIIFVTRLIEVVAAFSGAVCFYYEYVLGCYLVLLTFSIHTAIFSPAKFGVLPEIVSVNELSKANGIMTSVTYIASILGTFTVSFLTQITQSRFFETSLVCIFLSISGLLISLEIKKTPAQAPLSKIKWEFFSAIITTIKITRKKRFLLSSIIFGAFFFFLATNVQLNIVTFIHESLGLPAFVSGYLLVATSLGIGLGSFLIGKLSKNEIELSFSPIMGFGLGCSFCFLFYAQNIMICIISILFLLGVFGGAFIVPLHAFVQYASSKESRGRNIAVSNFLDFLGMLLASLSVFVFSGKFHYQVATIFFMLGIVSLLFSFVLLLLWYEQILRFSLEFISRLSNNVTIESLSHFDSDKNFFLANIKNNSEAVIFLAFLPRRIRVILSPSLKKYLLFKTFSILFPRLFLKKEKSFFKQIKLLQQSLENKDIICFLYDKEEAFDRYFVEQLQQKTNQSPNYLSIIETNNPSIRKIVLE